MRCLPQPLECEAFQVRLDRVQRQLGGTDHLNGLSDLRDGLGVHAGIKYDEAKREARGCEDCHGCGRNHDSAVVVRAEFHKAS